MSFDIHLQTHNYTGEMREFMNPFTGDRSRGPVDAGVSDDERGAIAGLLATAAPNGADEFGCYVMEFTDGGCAEVFASTLQSNEPFTGCMIAVRSSLSPELLDAIWRLCHLGRMSMMAAMEDSRPIVTDRNHLDLLPSDWDDAVVCDSPQQLAILLESVFSEWDKYRKQILDT